MLDHMATNRLLSPRGVDDDTGKRQYIEKQPAYFLATYLLQLYSEVAQRAQNSTQLKDPAITFIVTFGTIGTSTSARHSVVSKYVEGRDGALRCCSTALQTKAERMEKSY